MGEREPLKLYRDAYDITEITEASDLALNEKVNEYRAIILDPDTLPRQLKEAKRLLGNYVFELTMRGETE